MSKNEIPVTRTLPEQVKNSFLVLKRELVDPARLAGLKEEQLALEAEIKRVDDQSSELGKRKSLVYEEIERLEKIEETLKELEEKASEA